MPRRRAPYARLMQARLHTGRIDSTAQLERLPQLDTDHARRSPERPADFAHPFARFATVGPASSRLSGALRIRRAVLLLFSNPIPRECLRLWLLCSREWNQTLHWLDVSGLALYFLARIQEKQLEPMLPKPVLHRLRQNLADNTRRTASMLAESMAIQQKFQESGLHYAVLKGCSLWPHSVPRLELRSQLDLDYLIAEHDAPAAQRILEGYGYRLRAISGRSWEFKTDAPPSSLADLYCASPHRSLELHLESPSSSSSLLERLDHVPFHGISVPVLRAPDLFIGQGLHLYKHLCSEFYRPAHILEFRRHVIARRDDADFWDEVMERGEHSLATSLALGVVTLLTERVMGSFAPDAFRRWTVDRLPRPLRAWVDRYGVRSAVMNFPGSKVYLLLQQQMEALGIGSRRSARQALFPRRLPPAIAHPVANESLRAAIRRHCVQGRFVLQRLRFHLVAGLGYLRETRSWRQFIAAEANSPRMTKQ